MQKTYALFLTLFILLFPFACQAWDNTGHKIVANIAYQQLTPTTKAKVDALLKVSGPLFTPATSIETAATWADKIKLNGVTTYNHWHYIGLPFSADGKPIPAFNQKENVVWAIRKSEEVLKNPQSTVEQKALFLRFLLHLVGDIHQPLHCIDYYSKDFPRGDAGGNRFRIYYKHRVNNLHVFWDHGVGLFDEYRGKDKVAYFSKIATQRYPKSNFGNKVNDLNLDNWVKNCHALAINHAYQLQRGAAPSAEYLFQNQQLVIQQLALAGYRLGEMLNKIYSSPGEA